MALKRYILERCYLVFLYDDGKRVVAGLSELAQFHAMTLLQAEAIDLGLPTPGC